MRPTKYNPDGGNLSSEESQKKLNAFLQSYRVTVLQRLVEHVEKTKDLIPLRRSASDDEASAVVILMADLKNLVSLIPDDIPEKDKIRSRIESASQTRLQIDTELV